MRPSLGVRPWGGADGCAGRVAEGGVGAGLLVKGLALFGVGKGGLGGGEGKGTYAAVETVFVGAPAEAVAKADVSRVAAGAVFGVEVAGRVDGLRERGGVGWVEALRFSCFVVVVLLVAAVIVVFRVPVGGCGGKDG